ncbi:glycosyltransferase [Sagittula stellata]|uniref:Glycosyl transferase, group 1 n=1 Tax=Sagittula stellata (strain ATCC 700073 / DSM 11524 / E-37) TaxID=388399 RepID=A3KAS6_SAGS3|nr:glycosyltransferase [Sagittula stellata]EBA05722.1 glycosyl transferase, group 1 [Sagittula stellata E-37]
MTRLLDLTRLIARAGFRTTGIDRVIYCYLDHFVRDTSVPLFGIVRTAAGYILLDRSGCADLRDRIRDNRWGKPDLLSRIRRKYKPNLAAAESDMRRAALARSPARGLERMLKKRVGTGMQYFNLGQKAPTRRLLDTLKTLDGKIITMIYDTIPLDHPEFCVGRVTEMFDDFFQRMMKYSDITICISEFTRQNVLRHAAPFTPRTVTAHLGVEIDLPDIRPATPPGGRPYFVILSTIEVRKNHRLLLDIWPEIPEADLVIVGRRGWGVDELFERLDARPPHVFEYNNASDEEAFSLVKGSTGMLFPSFNEGYGLPPMEAAVMGVPVICNDLPIFREILGDYPVYADVNDRYLWIKAIRKLAQDHKAGVATQPPMEPPTWDDHFKAVLRHL